MGVQVGLDAEMNVGVCVALGTITGCFGGVVRDILSQSPPLIFHEEIYATASILGGLIYTALFFQFGEGVFIQVAAIICTIGIRLLSYRYELGLPQLGYEDGSQH
jgi:uncharacterized membrane protein YeiH